MGRMENVQVVWEMYGSYGKCTGCMGNVWVVWEMYGSYGKCMGRMENVIIIIIIIQTYKAPSI